MSKRGQVTIFIIIAILIVAIVAGILIFRKNFSKNNIPSEFESVYTSFTVCLEENLLTGIDVLESQGGYIYVPSFRLGSELYPSSSHLNFLGNSIPYWYYVSGGGIQEQQTPLKEDMQHDLEKFIESKINLCSFDGYYDEGYEISLDESLAEVKIRENQVELNLRVDMTINKGDDSFFIREHSVVVDSQLGNLYDSALSIFKKEQKDLFLEEYAIDFLRLYAPVDGVELTCSPKIWEANQVFDDLLDAIEVNTMALKSDGSNDYFDLDFGVEQDVSFLASRNWPNSFEVNPSEGSILMANPVGNQPGLGILGFCYVPYHFVYNFNYPVLVQIYSGDEIFQFPVVVVVRGNKEREPVQSSILSMELPELCTYKNTLTEVRIADSSSKSIDADISYSCFGTTCSIGETSEGRLIEEFPQCVNGFVFARAEGYRDTKIMYSTVEPGVINIIMEKIYEKEINLRVDGKSFNKNALITFSSSDFSETVSYPSDNTVELSPGSYEVSVYIYENSSLKLPASETQQCVDVPRGTIGGLLGLTKKECFDVEIPEQIISTSLSGGGVSEHNILEQDLINSNVLELNVESLPIPDSLEQLQTNYILFDEKEVSLRFR